MAFTLRPHHGAGSPIECNDVKEAAKVMRDINNPPPLPQELAARRKISAAMAELDDETRERVIKRVSDQYDPRQLVGALNAEMKDTEAEYNAKTVPLRERQRHLEGMQAALDDLRHNWAPMNDYALERNDCSRLHKIVEAVAADRVILPTGYNADNLAERLHGAQVFVVAHDWARAFDGATDYHEGAFRLPFAFCIFELRISGRTIIISARQQDERIGIFPFIELKDGFWWACLEEGGESPPVIDYVTKQVRAVSIALDAEVATRDVVRAPAALNAKRVKRGEVPLFDFHVIKLHGRITRQQMPGQHGSHRSPRMHFRRGHWRHYEAHKTWIRWTLVGNPELGFIDKTYRL